MQIAPPSLVRALTRRCLPQPVQVSWGERRARQARHSPRLSAWFQRRFLTRPQRKHSPWTIVLAMQPVTHERRCRFIRGTAAEVADQLMDHLMAEGLVD